MEEGVFIELFDATQTGEGVRATEDTVGHTTDHLAHCLHVQRAAHPDVVHRVMNDVFGSPVGLFSGGQFLGEGNGRDLRLRGGGQGLRHLSHSRRNRKPGRGILVALVSFDIELLNATGVEFGNLF